MTLTPTVGTHVFSTEDYEVRVASVTDAETKESIFVYGLYNSATGIREAELRALTTAMVWATKVQADLNEQRKVELTAAAIIEAMPEADSVGDTDLTIEEALAMAGDATPTLTEAELIAALDGD